jgi:hypothetical protein
MNGELVHTDHRGKHRARPDHQGDTQPGQVLGPLPAVGVAGAGRAFGETKPDEHHRRGAHVGEVVEGVAEQTDRAADQRHGELDQASQRQAGGGHGDRPVGIPPVSRVVEMADRGERVPRRALVE